MLLPRWKRKLESLVDLMQGTQFLFDFFIQFLKNNSVYNDSKSVVWFIVLYPMRVQKLTAGLW